MRPSQPSWPSEEPMSPQKTSLYMFPTKGYVLDEWVGCLIHPKHGRIDASGSNPDSVLKNLASKAFEKVLNEDWSADKFPSELFPYLDKLVEAQRQKLDVIQMMIRPS